MGEIFKVPQKAGQRGRPPQVKVIGAKRQDKEPEIVGAAVPGEPEVIDKATKQDKEPLEIHDHTQVVREGDGQVRQRKSEPGEPEIRAVVVDDEWRRVKDAD